MSGCQSIKVSGCGIMWFRRRDTLSSSLLLSSLRLSDTQVDEPQVRAILGTASHFYEVVDRIVNVACFVNSLFLLVQVPAVFDDADVLRGHYLDSDDRLVRGHGA